MAIAPSHGAPREIRIVSHCNLFYWWPVWAVGFLMAAITYVDGYVMAVVPAGSTVRQKAEVRVGEDVEAPVDVVVLPKGVKWRDVSPKAADAGADAVPTPNPPHLYVSRTKNLGVLFCTVLLLVIAITNIPLRGLWSVIVIVFIISLSVIFAILGWWEDILSYLSILDIRINLGGYLLISSVLFVLWLIVILFFDPQIYMVFTPGQFRVRLEIGEAETAYDTTGMTIQKQRSDLFRHWILGLGSGDLIVRTSGAQAHHFDMPNVLFVGQKVKQIEEMLRSRQVVAGSANP